MWSRTVRKSMNSIKLKFLLKFSINMLAIICNKISKLLTEINMQENDCFNDFFTTF